jgi:hypothetical protein
MLSVNALKKCARVCVELDSGVTTEACEDKKRVLPVDTVKGFLLDLLVLVDAIVDWHSS